MFHRLNLANEDARGSLSALRLAWAEGPSEPYMAWHQSKNLVLFPTSRSRRAIGRAVFGVRPDPIGALRRPMALPRASLAALEEHTSELVGTRARIAGLRIGAGGRRKLTVAFANEHGPLAIAQFPLVELAEQSLAHQEETISLLRRSGELACYLPEIISEIELGGKKGTLFSPGPLGRVRSLDNDVVSFLGDLHAATSQNWTISESGLVNSWLERLDVWRAMLGPSSSSVLEKAIHMVADRIDGIPIAHAIAHGDFTRWNLKRGRDGLFVFDWEASVRKSLPYHDLFHFVAAEAALLHRPSPTSHFRWRRLRLIAERISPAWAALQSPLYVGYLVETTLWYTSSREWHKLDGPGPFWRFLWAELAQANEATRLKG